jgi:small subunit ribosomal protein S15
MQMAEKKIAGLQRHDRDTGSPEAQIQILTAQITALQEHVAQNKKDFDAKRSLLQKVAKRRKLLKYLKESNLEAYTEVSNKTGLKC